MKWNDTTWNGTQDGTEIHGTEWALIVEWCSVVWCGVTWNGVVSYVTEYAIITCIQQSTLRAVTCSMILWNLAPRNKLITVL